MVFVKLVQILIKVLLLELYDQPDVVLKLGNKHCMHYKPVLVRVFLFLLHTV